MTSCKENLSVSSFALPVHCTPYQLTHPNQSLNYTVENQAEVVRKSAMADQTGINVIKARAVTVLLTDDIYGPRLSNCWMPAATFAEGMVKSGHIDASLVVDAKSST